MVVVVRCLFFLSLHFNLLEIYLSAKDVANRIGGKVRTIENWAAAGQIVQDSKGKYGLISVYKYQLEKTKVELARTKLLLDEKSIELERSEDELEIAARSAKNRKIIAEADKEEAIAAAKLLELEKMRGSLIDSEEVDRTWANLISTCVSKFQTMPSKLALQLSGRSDPAEIERLLRENINENLAELGKDTDNSDP